MCVAIASHNNHTHGYILQAPPIMLSTLHYLLGTALSALPAHRCAGAPCAEHAANKFRIALRWMSVRICLSVYLSVCLCLSCMHATTPCVGVYACLNVCVNLVMKLCVYACVHVCESACFGYILFLLFRQCIREIRTCMHTYTNKANIKAPCTLCAFVSDRIEYIMSVYVCMYVSISTHIHAYITP